MCEAKMPAHEIWSELMNKRTDNNNNKTTVRLCTSYQRPVKKTAAAAS